MIARRYCPATIEADFLGLKDGLLWTEKGEERVQASVAALLLSVSLAEVAGRRPTGTSPRGRIRMMQSRRV